MNFADVRTERSLEHARRRLLAQGDKLVTVQRLAHSRLKKLRKAEDRIAELERRLAIADYPPAPKCPYCDGRVSAFGDFCISCQGSLEISLRTAP